MAVPKAVLKKDPPEVIATRNRLRPTDDTVVIAKTNEGVLVRCRNVRDGLCKWPDGSMRPYSPLDAEDYVPGDIEKKLKDGIAERYEFKWCSTVPRVLSVRRGRERWEPVSVKANEVYCPFAEGDKTTDAVMNVDVQLHKRDRSYGEEVLRGKQAYNDFDQHLANKNAELNETLRSKGAQSVEIGIERDDSGAMSFQGAEVID